MGWGQLLCMGVGELLCMGGASLREAIPLPPRPPPSLAPKAPTPCIPSLLHARGTGCKRGKGDSVEWVSLGIAKLSTAFLVDDGIN